MVSLSCCRCTAHFCGKHTFNQHSNSYVQASSEFFNTLINKLPLKIKLFELTDILFGYVCCKRVLRQTWNPLGGQPDLEHIVFLLSQYPPCWDCMHKLLHPAANITAHVFSNIRVSSFQVSWVLEAVLWCVRTLLKIYLQMRNSAENT